MTRKIRRTAISCAIEATYGGSPGTFFGVLVVDPDFSVDPDVIPRDLVRGYYGGSEQLVGTKRAVIKFKTELAGSGTNDVPPAWGPLLRGCGMAQTITAASRVEYTPVSDITLSLVFRFNRDGARYTARGALGTVKLDLTAYMRPMLEWEFWGFDTIADQTPVPAQDFTLFQRPLVITDANSGDIRLGPTYAAGAVSGGTVLTSRGCSIDLGNSLQHNKMLGGESIDIDDREVTGKMMAELDAATEVTWRTDVNANTLTTWSFGHGTTAGNKILIYGPAVQRVKPQAVDYQGKIMLDTELRFLPLAVGGNDDIRIITK